MNDTSNRLLNDSLIVLNGDSSFVTRSDTSDVYPSTIDSIITSIDYTSLCIIGGVILCFIIVTCLIIRHSRMGKRLFYTDLYDKESIVVQLCKLSTRIRKKNFDFQGHIVAVDGDSSLIPISQHYNNGILLLYGMEKTFLYKLFQIEEIGNHEDECSLLGIIKNIHQLLSEDKIILVIATDKETIIHLRNSLVARQYKMQRLNRLSL